MKLFYSIDLHSLLIVVIGTNLLLSQSANADYIKRSWLDQRGFAEDARSKRSVFDFGIKGAIDGIKATALLLRGSEEILSATPNTRKFVKPGTFKTAVTDFFSVNPTNTRDYSRAGGVRGKVGTIGDRTITVETKEGSSIGTVTIFKRKMRDGKSAKEIIYTDFKTYPRYKNLEIDGEHISL